MRLFTDIHWTSLLNFPSRMWNAWSRILRRKPAVSIPSQRGSSRNSSSTWLHSSLAFSTGHYCRASSWRISASPRWRQSSKSLPSIRLCSAATGLSRTCRSFRRCLSGPSTSRCHRCLHGSAPPYLIRYFTPVSSIVGRSHLRSAATGTVFVPGSRTSTIGPRAFAVSSPSAWNSLPVDLRDPGISLLTFRRRLKTYLFNPPGYLSS